MAVSPRENDPPAPTRITKCKKADGEHKHYFSKHSEQVSLHWNQPLYRFEMNTDEDGSSTLSRSKSLPPPRNPVTAEGISESEGTLRSATGLRKRQFIHGAPEAALVTNHDLCANHHAKERENRLSADHKFAHLCSHTHEEGLRKTEEKVQVKGKNDRTVS